jgi:hypothetical protein
LDRYDARRGFARSFEVVFRSTFAKESKKMISGSQKPLDLTLMEPDLLRVPAAGVPEWIILLALAVVLLALGFLIFRTLRRPTVLPSSQEPASPLHAALDALGRLKDRHPSTRKEVDRFYVTLSRIVRRFVQEGWGIPALKKTSDETWAALGSQGTLPEKLSESFLKFLAGTDRVKFAGPGAGGAHLENDLSEALRLIKALAASLPMQAAPEPRDQRERGR